MLTQKELKEVFSYNSDNGLFTRILKTSSNCEVGDIAKCLNKEGYLVLRINAKLHRCHRLAWLYVYGKKDLILTTSQLATSLTLTH